MDYTRYKILLFTLPVLLLILSSCREDIIPPGNFAANINEPVKHSSPGNYSFVINAADVTTQLIDYSLLYGSRTSCHVTILDYNSGSVEIKIAGASGQLLFHRVYEGNIHAPSVIMEGEAPQTVQILFSNFTGKLKFELYKL